MNTNIAKESAAAAKLATETLAASTLARAAQTYMQRCIDDANAGLMDRAWRNLTAAENVAKRAYYGFKQNIDMTDNCEPDDIDKLLAEHVEARWSNHVETRLDGLQLFIDRQFITVEWTRGMVMSCGTLTITRENDDANCTEVEVRTDYSLFDVYTDGKGRRFAIYEIEPVE
jgi:hypothetical protein